MKSAFVFRSIAFAADYDRKALFATGAASRGTPGLLPNRFSKKVIFQRKEAFAKAKAMVD